MSTTVQTRQTARARLLAELADLAADEVPSGVERTPREER